MYQNEVGVLISCFDFVNAQSALSTDTLTRNLLRNDLRATVIYSALCGDFTTKILQMEQPLLGTSTSPLLQFVDRSSLLTVGEREGHITNVELQKQTCFIMYPSFLSHQSLCSKTSVRISACRSLTGPQEVTQIKGVRRRRTKKGKSR